MKKRVAANQSYLFNKFSMLKSSPFFKIENREEGKFKKHPVFFKRNL